MQKQDYVKLSRIVGSLQAVQFVLEKRYEDESYTLKKISELLKDSYIELEDFIQERLEKDIKCQ